MKFDPDPTPTRIVIIALLEFAVAFLMSLFTIVQGGAMPSEQQILAIFVGALLNLFVFLLAFIKGEEIKELE